MNLYKQLKIKQNELNKEVGALEKFLIMVPEGKIISHKKANNYYYTKKIHAEKEDKKYEEIYLPKDGKEAALLAKGEYAVRCLEDAKHELNCINKHLAILEKESMADRYLNTHPGIKELVAPSLKNKNEELEKWRVADYYKNPYMPEGIKTPTVIPGFKVRSKGEADIVARLVHYNIPFHYEEGFDTGKGWKFPDFTLRAIKPPYDIYYWEHLGGLDSFRYFSDNLNKLNEFYLCGIIPWQNLLITTETKDAPLDINWVDEIIKYYLM